LKSCPDKNEKGGHVEDSEVTSRKWFGKEVECRELREEKGGCSVELLEGEERESGPNERKWGNPAPTSKRERSNPPTLTISLKKQRVC